MSNIIIVEEDRLMRELLSEWLAAEGYSVRAVASPRLRGLGAPDLLIVDVYMPRCDGAAKLQAIKAVYPHTPIIAISAQFQAGLSGPCTTADALGVHQVIAKPCSRRDLLAAVADALPHAR